MPLIVDNIKNFIARLDWQFNCQIEEGRFFWKNPPKCRPSFLNKEVGCIIKNKRTGKEYWIITIDRKKYKRGHLIFLLLNGRMPFPCLDHKNGNSIDDRPSNIREATIAENNRNCHFHRKKANLPTGVTLIRNSKKYESRIRFDTKRIHLGVYSTPEEAHSVYMKKRKELFGDFA